jgi:hypothetical protein
MYYTGTKTECEAYNNEVYNGTESMKQDPFTTSYASIQEIEGQFYILKHEDFDSNMQEVNELPIDLTNTEI